MGIRIRFDQLAYIYYRNCVKKGKKPDLIRFGNSIQKKLMAEREKMIRELVDLLGFEIIAKSEIPDRQYRKNVKYKLNGRSYCFKSKKTTS